ncbi:MAG TPA: S8 family peptidase [Thermoanaerobaculia bacterium]|nr:S8 family peptidase [Thermoanaerobaculia bacterium]
MAKRDFESEKDKLDRTVIAIPLLEKIEAEEKAAAAARRKKVEHRPQLFPVIIDLNLNFPGGRDEAKKLTLEWIDLAIERKGTLPKTEQGVHLAKTRLSNQYVFGELEGQVIQELVRLNQGAEQGRGPIYRIWPDFEVHALLTRSVMTVKADAARVSFSAQGQGIVWAVMDSGIDEHHPHFQKYKNLQLPPPLLHQDFTALAGNEQPLVDEFGHGTHVAGILAGEAASSAAPTGEKVEIRFATRLRDENGKVLLKVEPLAAISGVAPKCKVLSLKVLDKTGVGRASSLIAAIAAIQEINGYGRRLLIQGVNISVGYEFDPEWFACGQSPLCVEVDRLVRSGVVVVVAAGNTGYGYIQAQGVAAASRAGLDLTINDPGNASLAITVGSTHRDMPHVYGVSYFSSKGPTGDGRLKPDLVAPGEKIISCAAGTKRNTLKASNNDAEYLEDSGTSMAAPHVSGAIAAFLSIRQEFIGRPEEVKQIFLSTATDLKRERYFQGHGLVDLMRAIQSV